MGLICPNEHNNFKKNLCKCKIKKNKKISLIFVIGLKLQFNIKESDTKFELTGVLRKDLLPHLVRRCYVPFHTKRQFQTVQY